MNIFFILLFMIFCHIIDDYFLQGILASMKQKDWWKEHAPQSIYKYDYIIALIMHSLSWSFMIMLPIAIKLNFIVSIKFILWYLMNAVIHLIVDDLKANRKLINLWQDQSIHLMQIGLTALYWWGVFRGYAPA